MKNHSCNGMRLLMPQKNRFLFFVLFCFAAFSGCKKEMAIRDGTSTITAFSTDNAVTPSATTFGGLISGMPVDDKMKVCSMLGVKYVRDAIILKGFTKAPYMDDYSKNGYKVLLNLNYDRVRNDNGNKNAVPFPTDMTEYKNLLIKVLDKYKPEIAIIENEPTTDKFHSGPIENYITELKTAVDVCKQRGIKVADGGLMIEYVKQVMQGYGSGSNFTETKKLISAYQTIGLDYVNIHTRGPNKGDSPDVYPVGVLENIANYLREQTGKQVICNEYSQENQSAGYMTSAVNGFEAGNYSYVIARSDDSDAKGQPLSIGTTALTTIGLAYKQAIQ